MEVVNEQLPVEDEPLPKWSKITFHQFHDQVGEALQPMDNEVTVDASRWPTSDHLNINNTRALIQKGVRFRYENNDLIVDCLSGSSVFIHCELYNLEAEVHTATVLEIKAGNSIKIFRSEDFDGWFLAGGGGNQIILELIPMCSIRMSLGGARWGMGCPNREVTDTPFWLKVHLTNPMMVLFLFKVALEPPTPALPLPPLQVDMAEGGCALDKKRLGETREKQEKNKKKKNKKKNKKKKAVKEEQLPLPTPTPTHTPWSSITLNQLHNQVREVFQPTDNVITIDGSWWPTNDNLNPDLLIDNTRMLIQKGVRFRYENKDLFVDCLSDTSVFVYSYLYNLEANIDTTTVVELTTGSSLKLFSFHYFGRLLQIGLLGRSRKLTQDLIRFCSSIRLSLGGVRWGCKCPIRKVTGTHFWIGIRVLAPLDLLNQILENFNLFVPFPFLILNPEALTP